MMQQSDTRDQLPSVLDVSLGDRHVGKLIRIDEDEVTFSFAREYIDDDERPTLSWGYFDPQGRLRTKDRGKISTVPAFFLNVLPEGDLRRYVAYHAGIAQNDDFALLWVTGDDLPGAVRVHDPYGRPLPPPAAGGPESPPATEELLRFSLAGVQLKFSAIENAYGGLTIRAQGEDGHWIVKLPSPRFQQVPENEFAMLQFAKMVGIEVPEFRLVDTAKIIGLPDEAKNLEGLSLAIRRFDRAADGRRIHIEDFNQIYRQDPERKYDGRTFANIAETTYLACGNGALVDFIRRLVFTVGIGNNDMHLKNWSFIYRDGRMPALAPAYDYVCTKAYLKHNQTGLPIASARYFPQVTLDQFVHLAKRARVSVGTVRQAAEEMVERMHSAWPQIKGILPFPTIAATIEEQFTRVPLFSHKQPPTTPQREEPIEEIS